MSNCWSNYKSGFFDELVDTKGTPRHAATTLYDYLGNLSTEELATRRFQ